MWYWIFKDTSKINVSDYKGHLNSCVPLGLIYLHTHSHTYTNCRENQGAAVFHLTNVAVLK